MTYDKLVALVGIVTSLVFSYFPGVNTWFNSLAANVKRLLQVGVAVVVAGAVFGLGCAGLVTGFACTWVGVQDAVWLIVAFLIANQAAYSLTPQK